MFSPTSTISPGSDWMLQSVSKSVTKQRAQALKANGDEHAATLWGERTTETAEFTLGGAYSGNLSLPSLGSGITDFTLTYSETEYPKLSVNKDSAAGGATFAFPSDITAPARAIGVPTTLTGIFTAAGSVAIKQLTIAVSCQHVEETDGSGAYSASTMSGMRDATITVTFTGVNGKPSPTMESGWTTASNSENDSNTAIGGGSIVYEKHFTTATATAST